MSEKSKKTTKNKENKARKKDEKKTAKMIKPGAPAVHENRVCIIGCGNVGMASAFALLQSELVRELVLIDADAKKAEGEAMDLQQAIAVPMEPPVKVTAGNYKDAAASSIVVITAGVATSDAEVSRLELLGKNVRIIREIVGKLKAENFQGILIVTTNPVDVLAQVAQRESGLPASRVISTGTVIDTARLRVLLAEELAVEPRAVDAFIIGEHGDSEIAVWSAARVAGLPLAKFPGAGKLPAPAEMLDQIRQAAPEIVKRKGNTSYAIGLCVRRICEAILRDERMALPVSTLLQGEYGIKGVYLGTPCIVGKNGVERVVELELNKTEKAGLLRSADVLRQALKECE
ncbi:MAG: L-lactate dehydrogenase [Acidobacteriota bacterium]|jgi:L-lactate dehydrogenase|nr:L-lactate dehydrogenase [Acidobacteriota bacterium]